MSNFRSIFKDFRTSPDVFDPFPPLPSTSLCDAVRRILIRRPELRRRVRLRTASPPSAGGVGEGTGAPPRGEIGAGKHRLGKLRPPRGLPKFPTAPAAQVSVICSSVNELMVQHWLAVTVLP